MDFFEAGSLVRLTQIFLDSSGTAIDPSVVKFQYLASALGVTTTYTYGVSGITKAGTGTYYVSIDTNESSGQYNWKFYSTGTGQASDIGTFYVRPDTTTLSAGVAANTVTFPLSVPNGGTGLTTFTANGILVGTSSNVIGQIAAANNAMLVTGPTGTPALNIASANLAVTNSVLNTIQDIQTTSTPQFTGLSITGSVGISGVGPHAIGGSSTANVQLLQTGTFTGSSNTTASQIQTTLNGTTNNSIFGLFVRPTLVETGSGTHPILAFLDVLGTITNGAAATTDAIGINVRTFAAGAGTATATGIRVDVPTGGTANRAIDILNGTLNITTGGSTTISTGVGSVRMSTANAATNTTWIPLSYAGTTVFVPAWATNAP